MTAYTAPRAPQATPPPLGHVEAQAEAERLATALMAALLPPGGPRRLALMTGPGRDRKYTDAPAGHSFELADMLDHLGGRRTWAAALLDRAGLAVAGCRDYDGDAGEGAALALQALDALDAAGLVAFAILLDGRAHVWSLYRRPAPAGDIRHQLAAHTPAGPGELYPSGNAIRLPLGVHRHKSTRGALVLQDGRRFTLDNRAELNAAVRALVALRRNAAPPPAPPEVRQRAAGAVTLADPALWEGVSAEQGAALMASARYRYLFARRPQLARLARGERVVITTDAGPDDTGNQQVAALVANLLSTGRPEAPDGPIVAGLGAPPLGEVRAVALHWAATLRPGYDLDGYRLDVDRLIAKYTPAGYAPEATRGVATVAAPAPVELPQARHRGRPAGDLARALDRLAAELAEGATVTRRGLALALGCTPRSITSHLAALRAAGRVELAPTARGYRVVRVENKSTPAPKTAPAQQNAANPAEGGNYQAPAEGGNLGPFAASECGTTTEEHTAPPVPPRPAPAGPAWGSDADRAALAGELVALGFPGRAWFVALEIADGERRAALLDGLRPLVAAEAEGRDRAALDRLAAGLAAAQGINLAGLNAAATADPTALSAAPALAELVAAALQALGQIVNPDTGELVRVRVDADLVRAWVAQRAPALDTTAIEQLLPAARAELRRQRVAGEWAQERANVRALTDDKLLALCKRRAARHAGAVKRSDPRAPYYAALATVADGERRRRGLGLAALDAEAQGQRPRKGRRQDFAERRAAQAGQAERRAAMLGLFDARAHASVTTAPAAPAYLDGPPADDAPHPAEASTAPAPRSPEDHHTAPASTAPIAPERPDGPGAGIGHALAERLRVVAARPRVQVEGGRELPQAAARADGFTADECDAWLLAQGWRRGPDGAWLAPAASPGKVVDCAD